jgi:uncharacterized protein
MAKTSSVPTIRALAATEVEEILRRNHVGRLAYARDSHIDIVPIHYVFDNGWIYGRTSPGTRIDMVGGWHPVAFEVDEIEDLFEWRSVVVHGGFYTIPEEGAPWEHDARMKAVGLLRKLIPEAFREDDPTPSRTLLFRIAVQESAGREATTQTIDTDATAG